MRTRNILITLCAATFLSVSLRATAQNAPSPLKVESTPAATNQVQTNEPPEFARALSDAALALTESRLRLLENALEMFNMTTGGYPTVLSSLLKTDGTPYWSGPYLRNEEEIVDAWGTAFAYERKGNTYELISAGPDRIAGTPDDVK